MLQQTKHWLRNFSVVTNWMLIIETGVFCWTSAQKFSLTQLVQFNRAGGIDISTNRV